MKISEGFRKLMEMIGENPEEFWDKPVMGNKSFKKTLDTEEKLRLFDNTVEKSLGESKIAGITGMEAAIAAISAAGEAILGHNRPVFPNERSNIERVVAAAGPLIRSVETRSSPMRSSVSTFGGIMRRK